MKSKIAPALLLIGLTPLLAQRYTASPDVPATAPNAGYPLHVRIMLTHWNHINGGYQGYGHGDVLGDTVSGFDYTYSCSEPFLHNAQKGEFYQAKWKKENQKLELLMQEMGSDHEHKCELKVSMKPAPYGHYGGAEAAPAAQPH